MLIKEFNEIIEDARRRFLKIGTSGGWYSYTRNYGVKKNIQVNGLYQNSRYLLGDIGRLMSLYGSEYKVKDLILKSVS